MRKKRGALRTAGISLALILLVVLGAFIIYTADYSKADKGMVASISQMKGVSFDSGRIVLEPEKPNGTGIVFYPGGKVEYTAYLAFLHKLQSKGYTCVLLKMPFNLAVFDVNAADKVYKDFPDITNWFVGGHSLGGAMASSYASKHPSSVEGLILCAAYVYGGYPYDRSLTLYGSNDSVLDRSKISYKENVFEIKGGNHAQFGNYGQQNGDGEAEITADEQQNKAADIIDAFIKNIEGSS